MNLQTFTTIEGRIGRQTWWLAMIVLWIAAIVVVFAAALLAALTGGASYSADGSFSYMHLLVAVIYFATAALGFVVNVRRWHDHGRSGWWNLALFVPVVGWLLGLVMLGLLPGDEGENRFGSPAVSGREVSVPRFGRAHN